MIYILGYGFLGKSFSDFLIAQNTSHVVLSKNITNSNTELVNFIKFDIKDVENQSSIFDSCKVLIHFQHATVPFTSVEKTSSEIQSDVEYNALLFDILGKKGIQKIIYISTGGAIYGIPKKQLVDEQHACNPISPYGISKLAIENHLKYYSNLHQYGYIILRPSNVFGRELNFNKKQGIVNSILCALQNKKPIEIWGNGEGKKDYLFINDFVLAIELVLKVNSIKNKTFNLSSGETKTVNEIINHFEETMGVLLPIEYLMKKSFDVQNIAIDNSLFRETYQWKPKYRFAEALKIILSNNL